MRRRRPRHADAMVASPPAVSTTCRVTREPSRPSKQDFNMPARRVVPVLLGAIITANKCYASSPLTPSGNAGGGGGPHQPPPYMPPPPGMAQQQRQFPSDEFEPPPGQQMAVEDRLSAWRHQQQEQYEHRTQQELNSIVDDEGRTKLLTTMSRTSVPIMFFILLTRVIHHYELADAAFKGAARIFFVLPTVALFLGNLSGLVVGAMGTIKGTGGTKRRLKAILNLNKLIEIFCMVYNVMRLTVVPSRYTPREVYVARIVTNFMFLSFCQVYTKVTWGGVTAKPAEAYGESYYESGNDWEGEQQQYGEESASASAYEQSPYDQDSQGYKSWQ